VSYDINLCDPVTGDVLTLDEPHHMRGGTYQVGGCREMWLNVTYNYAKHFYRVLGDDGIRSIYGKTGAETIPVLRTAIHELDTDADPDYWAATEGNARRALCDLLEMAQMQPDGVWQGD
jgi:hypothetical protein